MTRLALLAVALMPACVYVQGPQHVEHDSTAFEGEVQAVFFDVGAGDLLVRVADVPAVEVHRTLRWSGDRPDALLTLDTDGTLVMDVDCRPNGGPFRVDGCSVDHEVLLPAGSVVVEGITGAGDIRLEGTDELVDVETGSGDVWIDQAGRVFAATGSGDIDLFDARGALTLETGSGDVKGTGLRGGSGVVSTGSGNVDLFWKMAPELVDIATGSGDVDLSIPPGSYRVDVDTGSGNVSVQGITTDPSASSSIAIETGSGDIRVEGIPGA